MKSCEAALCPSLNASLALSALAECLYSSVQEGNDDVGDVTLLRSEGSCGVHLFRQTQPISMKRRGRN